MSYGVIRHCYDNWQHIDWRADGIEYRTMELESRIEDLERDASEVENYGDKMERLRNHARRTHCGLILMGGFTAPYTPNTTTINAYDVLQELNAGNFLARRSLENMKASTEQFWGHKVMLKAATDGATPSEGPLNKMFKTGNREISMRDQYIAEQASQLCGRFEAKLGQLHGKYWNLLSSGQNDAADMVEKEMEKYMELLECAVMRRNFPDRQPTEISTSRNTVHSKKHKNEMEENGLWWQSELKKAF